MNRHSWSIFCLAYITGLLATGIFYFNSEEVFWFDRSLAILGLTIAVIIVRFIWKKASKYFIKDRVWLISIAISILATGYFQLRVPELNNNDINYRVEESKGSLVILSGRVLNEPRINSNDKLRFTLKAKNLTIVDSKIGEIEVEGKVYATLPLMEGKTIRPQDFVKVKGILYEPKSIINIGQFDFKSYLNRQGIFTGFSGFELISKENKTIGLWKIRQRIVRSQVRGLGSPWGQLLSSMVLGKRAVDLPEDIRNLFIKAGLAHVLAASGFHVSILLGIVLSLTNSLTGKNKLIIGGVVLFFYMGLTGFSPSVVRAGLMGLSLLIALATDSKVRPLASLLLVATILLIINPLWIWNLGFQLSFLATLGLIVTLPSVQKKLDWLVPLLGDSIAIPLAASIWTLPLIIYSFKTIPSYSILINVLVNPFVILISLGGMISGFISLIFPFLGTAIAWCLQYPIFLLVGIIKFFINLPGSTYATGKIDLILLIIIYSILILVWLNKWCQKHWWMGLILTIGLITIPLAISQINLTSITVLATKHPVLVIQDRGKVILINTQDIKTIKYTIIPFLNDRGINKIDYGINLTELDNWSYLKNNLKIDRLIPPNSQSSKIITNSFEIITTVNKLPILEIKTKNNKWLIIDRIPPEKNPEFDPYLQNKLNSDYSVLVWSGNKINNNWLKKIKWQTAIANSHKLTEDNEETLLSKSTQIFLTNKEGSITWTTKKGFNRDLLKNDIIW